MRKIKRRVKNVNGNEMSKYMKSYVFLRQEEEDSEVVWKMVSLKQMGANDVFKAFTEEGRRVRMADGANVFQMQMIDKKLYPVPVRKEDIDTSAKFVLQKKLKAKKVEGMLADDMELFSMSQEDNDRKGEEGYQPNLELARIGDLGYTKSLAEKMGWSPTRLRKALNRRWVEDEKGKFVDVTSIK